MTILHLITAAALVGSMHLGTPLSESSGAFSPLPVPVPLVYPVPTGSVPEIPFGIPSGNSTSIPSPYATAMACGSTESGRTGPCGRAGCGGRDQYCTSYVVFNFLGFTLYRHCTGTMRGVENAKMEW